MLANPPHPSFKCVHCCLFSCYLKSRSKKRHRDARVKRISRQSFLFSVCFFFVECYVFFQRSYNACNNHNSAYVYTDSFAKSSWVIVFPAQSSQVILRGTSNGAQKTRNKWNIYYFPVFFTHTIMEHGAFISLTIYGRKWICFGFLICFGICINVNANRYPTDTHATEKRWHYLRGVHHFFHRVLCSERAMNNNKYRFVNNQIQAELCWCEPANTVSFCCCCRFTFSGISPSQKPFEYMHKKQCLPSIELVCGARWKHTLKLSESRCRVCICTAASIIHSRAIYLPFANDKTTIYLKHFKIVHNFQSFLFRLGLWPKPSKATIQNDKSEENRHDSSIRFICNLCRMSIPMFRKSVSIEWRFDFSRTMNKWALCWYVYSVHCVHTPNAMPNAISITFWYTHLPYDLWPIC